MWPTLGALLQAKASQAKQNTSVLCLGTCLPVHHPHILHHPAKAPWQAELSLGVQAKEQSAGGFKSCSCRG